VPQSMLTRFIAIAIALALNACSSECRPQEKVFVDPIAGSKTVMNVVKLGDLEVVAMRDKPDGLGTLIIRGKPIVAYICGPNGSCDISVFGGKVPAVTVTTQARGEGLKEVQVEGSEWSTWDTNADGQIDMRIRRESKTVEI